MDDSLEIKKVYEKNDSILDFTFNGRPRKDNLSIEEIETLSDKCFEKMEVYHDVHLIMTWIRTIFKDFEETRLQVSILEIGKETKITYKNENLTLFEVKKNIEMGNVLKVSYTKPINFQVSVLSENLVSFEQQSFYDYEEKIKDIMKSFPHFRSYYPIYLDSGDIAICEIYKLFYGEYPDFSSDNISKKIQSMIYILKQFCFFSLYSFYSTYVEWGINTDKLIPLGKIKKIEPTGASKDEKRRINIVGKFVRNYTQGEEKKLIQLCEIIRSGWGIYNLCKNVDILNVPEKSGYSIEDVEESIELVRKIKNELWKEQK